MSKQQDKWRGSVRIRTLIGVGALLVGSVHAAELDMSNCVFPEQPEVPSGATASEQEMADAGQAVRAYVAETQGALECLETVEAGLGEEITSDQQAEMVSTYNQGVDGMSAVAESYNAAVRAFKER
jgi:hypothetical protein